MVTATTDPPDPLRLNVRIVDIKDGTPTQEFLRQWNRQRAVNVTVDNVTVDLTALETAVSDIQDVDIVAGVGLSGGGSISGPADVTVDLEDTAVTPGTYGNATNSAQVTVDQQGRITAAANIPIAGGASSGSGGSSGGGEWAFVETVSVSGASNADIDIPADANILRLVGYFLPVNDNVKLLANFTTDGFSTIVNAAASYSWVNQLNFPGSANESYENSTSATTMQLIPQIGNVAGEYVQVEITINRARDSSDRSSISVTGAYPSHNGSALINLMSGALRLAAEDDDGVRLTMSSGDFSGQVHVYRLNTT